MRAIVEGGIIDTSEISVVFSSILILLGLQRLRFLSCALCDRSKYQSWMYLRDYETPWSVNQ